MRADVFSHNLWQVRANFVQNSANAGQSVDLTKAMAGVVQFSSDFVPTTGIRFQLSVDGTNWTNAAADGTAFGDSAGASYTVAASAVVPIPPSCFGAPYVRIKPATAQPNTNPTSYAIFHLKA